MPRITHGRGIEIGYYSTVAAMNDEITVSKPGKPLPDEVLGDLELRLRVCLDLAFAYLVDVEVVGAGEGPSPTLFVWLEPEAVGSLRSALNVVSEAVADALPKSSFLDVLILNSAPELLDRIESVDALFIERDPSERRRALAAAAAGGPALEPLPARRWWWPF
jgi:hypothetical protein